MSKSLEDSLNDTLSPLIADGEKIKSEILFNKKPYGKNVPHWRMPLIAACLVIALSVTILAAGFGDFDLFFGENTELIKDNISEINKSVENNGILFTIVSAYTTESGGYVTATFTKTNGDVFGNEPHNGNPIFGRGFGVETKDEFKYDPTRLYQAPNVPFQLSCVLSEDEKTLNVLFAVPRTSEKDKLAGKNVSIEVESIQGPRSGAYYEGPWSIDMNMPPVDGVVKYDINFASEITIGNKKKTCTIESISFTPMGIIAVGTGDPYAIVNILQNMQYSPKGEPWFYVMRQTKLYYEKDGKIYYYGMCSTPIPYKDIESVYINYTEISLK